MTWALFGKIPGEYSLLNTSYVESKLFRPLLLVISQELVVLKLGEINETDGFLPYVPSQLH